jgi:hypothetical protein
MSSYNLHLSGTIYAESWEEALAEAQRLRLTVSNARENVELAPSYAPPMLFEGSLNDGRSRPPGIPRTEDEHRRVTGGYADLKGPTQEKP